MKGHDGFRSGVGVFKCLNCGKMTRTVREYGNTTLCVKCTEIGEHENAHADQNFPNDDCGNPDCPVKNYQIENKWWLK